MDHHTEGLLAERHGLSSFEEIGRGGMGVVFKAWDEALQRSVAVKTLSTELLDDAGLRRFTTEMQTLGKIRHSAIVSVHYSGMINDDEGKPLLAYFVMDYVPGGTLNDLIRERREYRQHFSVSETVELLRPIAAALDYLHGTMNPPVVHRDIKPGNVLVPVVEPGEATFEARSLLTDFGISLTPDDTRVTDLSLMIGTERYFAPELYPGEAQGTEGVFHNQPNAASDNYALSLVAFEMMTLYPLKDTMSPADWRNERVFPRIRELGISPQDSGNVDAVEDVFRTAFAHAPAYRFPTATAFVEALAWTGGQHGMPAPAPAGGQYTAEQAPPTRNTQESGQEPKKKRGWVTTLMTVLAVILLVGGLAGLGVYRFLMTPDWKGAEESVARIFPDVVSERQNLQGWRDLTCRSAEPEQGQLARIVCADSDLFVAVSDYGSRNNREDHVNTEGGELLRRADCEALSVEVKGNQRPSWSVLPTGARSQYAVLVSSLNAKTDRLEVPIC